MRELLLELSVLVRIRHPNIVTFWGTAADFPVAQGGDFAISSANSTAAHASPYGYAVSTIFADSHWRCMRPGLQASRTLAWSSSCAAEAAFTRRCIKITANAFPSRRKCGALLVTMHVQSLHTLNVPPRACFPGHSVKTHSGDPRKPADFLKRNLS